MPKKGKKGTPPELDFIFDRHLIDEDQYRDFWGNWFKISSEERKKLISKFEEDLYETEEEKEAPKKPTTGTITKNRKLAEQQALAIGGYVARRNAKGQFSKRGRNYQAIRRKRANR